MINSILEYSRKLDNYTQAKCALDRNLETCVLEQIYFTNRAKQHIANTKECSEKNIKDNKKLEVCYKEGIGNVDMLKQEVNAMIQVSKNEIQ